MIGKKIFGIGITGLIIIAIMSFAIMPVQAQTTELRITSDNLCTLWGYSNWAYWNNQLTWSYGWQLDATYERSLYYGCYTQHADNNGWLWGECVSSVKALSGDNTLTGEEHPEWLNRWHKGRRVVDGGVPSGTAIATFFGSGNTYSGHTAILKAYIVDGQSNIIGIQIWDQNTHWIDLNGNGIQNSGEGIFGRWNMYRTGSSTWDADNYYVIEV